MQAHRPISEQHSIEGHSVRAVYLLTAVADLVHTNKASPSQEVTGLRDAMYRLWDNMVLRKMYVTGGIGAVKQWEGFGSDYFLPQGTDEGGCYAETCASIGVMMLAERILQVMAQPFYLMIPFTTDTYGDRSILMAASPTSWNSICTMRC